MSERPFSSEVIIREFYDRPDCWVTAICSALAIERRGSGVVEAHSWLGVPSVKADDFGTKDCLLARKSSEAGAR
jgi:hypothetical protein